MTGDGKAIGTKFGISFAGRWVWRMKDYIDVGFMKLFTPEFLFNNYDMSKTTREQRHLISPIEHNELFEEEKASEKARLDPLRAQVASMSPKVSAESLLCSEEEEEFFERLFIIDRMGKDEAYMRDVVQAFNAIKGQRPKIVL